jgi:hypothetical protein
MQKDITDFNKIENIFDFVLGTTGQKVYITNKLRQCLMADKVLSSSVATECSGKEFTLNLCGDNWYQFQLSEKTCLAETDTGISVVSCDCKSTGQLFSLTKNLNRSIFVTGKASNKVWQNDSTKVSIEKLQG